MLKVICTIAVVAVSVWTAPAVAQSHGVSVLAICDSPVRVGETLPCQSRICHDDGFGDSIEVTEVWAILDPGGLNIRVPETGSLPVCMISDNAITTGGTWPATIGAPFSTLAGLPGADAPGYVYACLDSHVVQADYPSLLVIGFTWIVSDNCDDPNTMGCFSFPNPVQFTTAIEIICEGDADGDGDVDFNDLYNVILDWGTDGSANGGDVTGPLPGSPPDGIVNVNDLVAVVTNWGSCT